MRAYEMKWNAKAKDKFPKTFLNAYPNAVAKVIHPLNYTDFLLEAKQSYKDQ